MKEKLAERGVRLEADEMEEMENTQPALRAWIEIVERLAAGQPAFIAPPESER